MQRIDWGRVAGIVICVGAAGVALAVIWRFVLPLLIPFLIAWVISCLIRPLSHRLSNKTKLPRKLCAIILLSLFLASSAFLLGIAVDRLLSELQKLLERLLGEGGILSEAVAHPTDYFEMLTSKWGLLKRINASDRFSAFRDTFNEQVEEILKSIFQSLVSGIPGMAGRIVAALPSILMVSVVTLISCFYFSLSDKSLFQSLRPFLPRSILEKLPDWKKRLRSVSFRYLRAYLFLLLITLLQLFVGFTVLRVEYAFLLSLVVALIDLLPVLGVGTVLIPWSVISFLKHDFALGLGLVILYLAVVISRQILEPRLLGKSLGLPPLLVLFSTYAGWRLFGIFGMVAAPIAVLIGRSLFSQWRVGR